MLVKTLAGFFLGLLISASFILNLNLILPFEIDTLLLFGLLSAFPIWGGIQVWFFASPLLKKTVVQSLMVLLPSVLFNVLLLSTR